MAKKFPTTKRQENYIIEVLQLVDYYQENTTGDTEMFHVKGSGNPWHLDNVRSVLTKILSSQKYHERHRTYLNLMAELYLALKQWKWDYEYLPF